MFDAVIIAESIKAVVRASKSPKEKDRDGKTVNGISIREERKLI